MSEATGPEDTAEESITKTDQTQMDIDSVFNKYDENSDGKIQHSEYVEVHGSGTGGGVSGILDRLLDDSPELRGQRLWVMFSISIVLVAALNAYAMVREPELVAIEDLVQHSNEVVSIKGSVVSWVEDPYSSGEDRVNILVEDSTGVAQLRWYNFAEIPMLGTEIKVTGDVIVYNGKIWIQAIGSGAVSWDEADVPEAPELTISAIAKAPEDYMGDTVTVSGYISKPVNPDSTFTSLTLRDHPSYGMQEYQMNMIIHSAPGQWLESGQKVEVTATLDYSEKYLQWSMHVQGPEIRVVRTHEPVPTKIGWSNYQTWSYNSGALIIIEGMIDDDEIIEPNGDLRACLLNTPDLTDYQGEVVTYGGRLVWSTSYAGWCVDSTSSSSIQLLDITDAENILGYLSMNPKSTFDEVENSTRYLISGVVSGSYLMSENGDTKISIADAVYPNTLTKMDAYVPVGQHSGWLEDGQDIVANVSISWNSNSNEFQLIVYDLVLTGDTPEPNPYDLADGAPQFYDLNKITSIVGNVVEIDGATYLQKEGGEQKIMIDIDPTSIGLNSYHEGLTLKWIGRLIEMPDDVTLSHYYVLSDADVVDMDGNGIADDAEDL